MYRAPDTARRCPSCGGASITPPTKFDPSEGFSYVYFARTDDPAEQRYSVNRASVCLDCGHTALSFGPKKLALIRHQLATLVPLPEE